MLILQSPAALRLDFAWFMLHDTSIHKMHENVFNMLESIHFCSYMIILSFIWQ